MVANQNTGVTCSETYPVSKQAEEQPMVLNIAIYGVPKLLDYLPPAGVKLAECTPGKRARVELWRREHIGIIIQHSTSSLAVEKIKPCIEVPDSNALLDPILLKLVSWSSKYYLCDIATAINTALPKYLLQHREQQPDTGWTIANLTDKQAIKLTKAQQQLIDLFAKHGGTLHQHQLSTISPVTIKNLAKAGIIQPAKAITEATSNWVIDHKIMLNTPQRDAANAVLATPGYYCTLLYGVTGSGKTQVYLELVRRVIEQGKQALVLVPEIGLTPQTLTRFERHFGKAIGVVHSALTNREREASWRSARSGTVRLVIGTRSAIWSPFVNLGLIVVDEEHDGSFKQHSELRYNARDLALMRAKTAGCPVVLGSATPLLSSIYKADQQQIRVIRLDQRATQAPMPQIEMIDMRTMPPKQFIAPQALEAITTQLENNKQALVFLNRRGFSPLLQCFSCGWQAMCNNCDSRMTLHQLPSWLLCHHCGERQHIPASCPQCQRKSLQTLGSGTQHIAGYLQRHFPSVQIIRIDRDSVGSKGRLQTTLKRMGTRQAVILVGTQMLAKGHDFAHLGLVVVLEADNGLFSSDFRAPEVTLQLLLQVAGRAGRSGERGQVLIQTNQPEAEYFGFVKNSDYDGLAQLLLQERKRNSLPPYHSLVLLSAQHQDKQRLDKFMQQACKHIEQLALANVHLRVLGPAPPAIGKLAGLWREQILVFHPSRTKLHQLCESWRKDLYIIRPICKWHFDADPYQVV